ncbi:MAG: flagellar motor protein MotB [Proteobacteria bacterium]|nr:flagellar motor protein MotB [Pseudomonadota bacterium]
MSNLEVPYYAQAAAVEPEIKKAPEHPKPGTLRKAMSESPSAAEAGSEPETPKPHVSALRGGGSGRLSGSVTEFRPKEKEGAGEGENWTMTYMDLVTLLLAFLVTLAVLADFSVPQLKLPGADGETKEQGLEDTPKGPQLINNIVEILRSSQFADNVDVEIEEGKIVLRLRERLLFSSGAAGLSQDGADLLDMLVPVLLYHKTAISVEGHTDNLPVAGGKFTSNWELSSTRAIAVVEFLIGRGLDGGSMRAIGYADTMPIGDNATAEGRARNRRVSLVIEPQGKF